jgi:hypothetical protein
MKTPISRRIFFWTLFVSYFITTGLVLFFVFGYRHDFRQKVFIYTGSLTLKTNPKDVKIKLNDKEPSSRLLNVINDSYFITGLRPGEYKVSVFADGFKVWNKNINIHSGISTELWNITLLREQYERTEFDIQHIDKFYPAPAENIFATTRQLGKTLNVSIFDTKKDEIINSFIFPKIVFTDNVYENIEWSPTSKNLLIPVEQLAFNNKKDTIVVFAKNNKHFFLSEFINDQEARKVRWAPEEKDVIYFLTAHELTRAKFTPEEELQDLKILANDVISYDFADDGIYLLNTKGEIWYGGDKKQAKNLELLVKFDIDTSHNRYRLIAYDNHRIILIDDNTKELFLYNKGEHQKYVKKLGDNIIGAHFSDDGKKLLFYSSFEIFTYFTRDWDTQPIRKEDQVQSIIRFSQPLHNVHFSKDYEHIIYTTGIDLKITELDYRGNRYTETIIQLPEDTTVVDKHKINKIFFIDTKNGKKRGLMSIEFPEKETLF